MPSIGATELVLFELLTLAVPLLVLVLLFFLVRRAVRDGEPSASEALDRRYATGELTREAYLTIRDDIMREQNA